MSRGLTIVPTATLGAGGRGRFEPLYPILYLDCIHVKVRDAGAVRTKEVYLAIGVNLDGHKEVLGLWISQTEAKFWLQVVTELRSRGVQDRPGR